MTLHQILGKKLIDSLDIMANLKKKKAEADVVSVKNGEEIGPGGISRG